MKKLIFTAVFIVSCLSARFANAQIHVSFGVNIGAQPEWGPVGYDHADYYYMPDIDAYYDVYQHQYVYNNNNVWIHSNNLPPRYANYDVYHGYKVVVNQQQPWRHHEQIRARYAQYRGRHDQTVIRDSHDAHYQNHWHGDDHHGDNGRGHDHGDNGRGHDNGNHGRGHDNGNQGRGHDNGNQGRGHDDGHNGHDDHHDKG